jgi:formylglycine-generating enzyme required for sulfatase activity
MTRTQRPMRVLPVVTMLLAACATDPTIAPTTKIHDCPDCPVMVKLPGGTFMMGTAEADRLIDPRTGKPAKNDGPQHAVMIEPFAIGKYEVTVGEYRAFVEATGHSDGGGCMEFGAEDTFKIRKDINWDATEFSQTDDSPVGCVSFLDANAYTDWLSEVTGKTYRLPTEAEWEYAARAGTTTPYHWGADAEQACQYANIRSPGADTISKRQAQSDIEDGFTCDDGAAQSSPVGSYLPNDFGLHDMQGNAWEWVADCNHKDYRDAPADGSAWLDEGPCQFGIIRSGSFLNRVERSSTTVRAGRPQSGRATNMGFRVAMGGVTNSAATRGEVISADAGVGDDSVGARVFDANCAACHVDRTYYKGIYGTNQQAVETAIRGGGNNVMSMPAFDGVLTDAEISAVAEYVRQQNGWN